MDKSDRERILHIKTYCEEIAEFIERFGDDYQIFTQDRAFYNSVCMDIMQIGECASRLSDEFRDRTKDRIPWGMVKGMRNIIAHAYLTANDEYLWETATQDVPMLLQFCSDIIEQERGENELSQRCETRSLKHKLEEAEKRVSENPPQPSKGKNEKREH